MSQFMGTHFNKLDAKGRVSIPSSFRALLRANGTDNGEPILVLRPSHKYPCVEGWTAPDFRALATPLETMDMFSDEHDDLSTALYAGACPMDPDREGRIVLPEALVAHAGLTDSVAFMGAGPHFQIWEPAAAARRQTEAQERARMRSLTIPGKSARGTPAA